MNRHHDDDVIAKARRGMPVVLIVTTGKCMEVVRWDRHGNRSVIGRADSLVSHRRVDQ